MDNVTHTFAGLLIAEAVIQGRKRRGTLEPGFASAAYWVSALANNLPDLDFIYVGVTGGKLGYLLHHRGHTHTLAFVPIAGCVVFAGAWLALRRRGQPLGKGSLRWLVALAALGPLVHLALDFTNNYGVHPLWPLDNRWFYGDRVFIIEPYLLASGIACFLFTARRVWARAVTGLLAAILLTAIWGISLVPAATAVAFTLCFGALVWGAWRLSGAARVALCATSWLLATALFVVSGSVADSALRSAREPRDMLDRVLTPLPATPWCWSALSLERHGSEYRVVSANVTPFPSLFDAADCPDPSLRSRTAPTVRVDAPPSRAVRYRGQFVGDVSGLRALAREDCRARAFLRYARAPFWTASVIGDLRYDRERGLGFAELALGDRHCPRAVPPWQPPRADLLGERE